MLPIRSIIPILFFLFISNLSFSQDNEVNRDTILQESDETLNVNSSEDDLNGSLDTESKTSEPTLRLAKIYNPQKREIDKVFNKYLDLDKKDLRYNLNFNKIDYYSYTDKKDKNLSIMSTGLKPNYTDTNYIPSFSEEMLSGFVKSILLGLR